MLHLIKKDLIVQKKMVKLAILYLFFFTILFSKNETIGFLIGVFSVTYLLSAGAFAIDEKNNSDRLLLSMPIKRSTIVLQKYVSVYLYAAGAVLLTYAVCLLMKLFHIPLNEETISLENLWNVAAIVTFYTAFTYPFVFKFGYMRSRAVQMISFFVLILIGMPIIEQLASGNGPAFVVAMISFVNEISSVGQTILLAVILTFILISSYLCSLSFYKAREC